MKNWDEYDDISENEGNELKNDIQSHQIILNEAKNLIFIRKYSKYNINNNDLEKIIKECNYDDKYIINKINNYLIKNCKKSNQYNKKNNNNRFKKHNKNKYHNKKLKYKEREIEIEYNNNENEINNEMENNNNENEINNEMENNNYENEINNEMENNNYENEINNNLDNIKEIKNENNKENLEEEIKITNPNTRSISTSRNSKASTSPENIGLKHFYSSDLNNNNYNIKNRNLSPFSFENSSYIPKTNLYASYLLGNNDNFIKKDSISNFNLKGAKFPSKLFPGVFFDQPIDKDNLIQEENNNNFNWDMVINYYKNPSTSSI